METSDILKRGSMDLHEGILSKFKQLRTRQLEKHIAETCYAKKSSSIKDAEQCQKFTMNNDYKLNQINNFMSDHIPKHIEQYQ